jgi:hypothetical protein
VISLVFGEFCSLLHNDSTNWPRLILYFPVSALVTLFGNILQNPQDPRARSDIRLMNLVVIFLSMLVQEEENGGVKRMLGVCSEFERIAKVVVDKAEKETSSRRKRKGHEDHAAKSAHSSRPAIPNTPSMPPNSFSPPATFSGTPSGMTTNVLEQPMFSPPLNGSMSGSMSGSVNGSSPGWVPDASFGDGPDYGGANGGMTPFAEIQGYSNNNVNSPLNMNIFQQPFVPQDLWQMPMTLEWDWADMTGGAYPSFENGVLGELNLTVGHQQ